MFRIPSIHLAAASAVTAIGALCPGQTHADPPLHLELGRQLVAEIQASQANGVFTDANNGDVEINRYGGSWSSTYIQFADAPNNILPGSYSKCASFVSRALRTAYNWDWDDYTFWDPIELIWKDTSSPASYRYEALIKQEKGFLPEITRLDQVQPGDVITMVYVNDDSGHTGLVNEVFLNSGKAYPEGYANSDPTLYGTTYYELDILDCSSSDHTNDTREFTYNGVDYDTDGVGIGTMGVLVDQNFEVVGYTWSLPSSDYHTSPNSWLGGLHNRLKLQTVRAVTFGRLDLSVLEDGGELDTPSEPNPQEPTPDPDPEPTPVHEAGVPVVAGPLHLTLGLELVDQMVSQQQDGTWLDDDGVAYNRYGGSWSSSTDQVYLSWQDLNQELPAANYSKCSSFVSLLLQAAYNWDWDDHTFWDPITLEWKDTSSPSSYRYVALIKQEVGFEEHIVRLDDAAPGDIIACQDVGDDSGHTLIFIDVDWASAKAYPEDLVDSDPTLFGTTYYEVLIMDVCQSAHSFDTRRIFTGDQEEETGGAGVGVMGILVDANMNVVGHTWSIPSFNYITKADSWLNSLHSRLKRQDTDRELVIGRLPDPNAE